MPRALVLRLVEGAERRATLAPWSGGCGRCSFHQRRLVSRHIGRGSLLGRVSLAAKLELNALLAEQRLKGFEQGRGRVRFRARSVAAAQAQQVAKVGLISAGIETTAGEGRLVGTKKSAKGQRVVRVVRILRRGDDLVEEGNICVANRTSALPSPAINGA